MLHNDSEKALFDRLGIYHSITTALRTLSATGAPDQVLWVYLQLMRQHDVAAHAFKENEGVHRDLLWMVVLDNPSLTASAEFKVVNVRIAHQL